MARRLKFLLTTGPIYLLLLWLIASSVRWRGWQIFAVGALLLPVASLLLWRGRRAPLFVLYLAALLAGGAAAALEGVLRFAPGILQGHVANRVYGVYHIHAGGIYSRDDHLGYVLRANFRTWAFWNGHWWRHTANERGYRGPHHAHADAVFLGDSMIYGHGVDDGQTVSAQFEALTSCPAANLGVQGCDAVRAFLLLERFGPELQPRRVFLCCHFNDLDDLAFAYEDHELQAFLESPSAAPYRPLARRPLRPSPASLTQHWNAYVALPLRVAGLTEGSVRLVRDCLAGRHVEIVQQSPAPETNFLPFPDFVESAYDVASPERAFRWRCHVHALAAIHDWCQQHGAELTLFDLGYPHDFSEKIAAWAREHGVKYSPAGVVVLEQARHGAPMYLANDGHWTAAGCLAIARALADTAD